MLSNLRAPSATAVARATLENEHCVGPLQRRLDILKEEQVYNQVYIERLDNQLAVMRLMYRMQVERLEEIQKRIGEEELEVERDVLV